jgi:hypothetical protein
MARLIIFLLFIFNNVMAVDDSTNENPIEALRQEHAVDEETNNGIGVTVGELLNCVIDLDQNTSIIRTARRATPSLQHIGMIAFLSLGLAIDGYERFNTYSRTYGGVTPGWLDLAPSGLPYSCLCLCGALEMCCAFLLPFFTWFEDSVVFDKLLFYEKKRNLRKRSPDSLATEDDIKIVGEYLAKANFPLLSKFNSVQLMYLLHQKDCFIAMENLFDSEEHKYLHRPVIEKLFAMARMSNADLQVEIDEALSDDNLVQKFGHIKYFCNLLYHSLRQRHMAYEDLQIIRTKLLAIHGGLRNGPLVEKLVALNKKDLTDLEQALADEKILDDVDNVEGFCYVLRRFWSETQNIQDRLDKLEIKYKKSK